jgi:dihydropteroate synthase
MQSLTQYDHLVEDILLFFSERCNQARACGVMDILVDPGFGFAKTVEQNFALMRELHRFEVLNRAILVGISRKSMIYKTLNTDAAGALNGTTALHMFALQKGAHILRVHDVKPAMECIALHQHLQVS